MLISRPDPVLLLQPWSTAMIQTKKRINVAHASTFMSSLAWMDGFI